jgi:tetraacyldisaccharide 4'-kinase
MRPLAPYNEPVDPLDRTVRPGVTVLTRPFARIVGAVAMARRRLVERHPQLVRRLRRPVVSVGNLAVGGRGKTPVVAAIAAFLRDRGARPSILSRGYGRTGALDGVVVVRDAQHVHAGLATAGDEPLMLARRLHGVVVVVAADRYLAGRLAESRLGCTVHVLDDGFQHLRLAREVDLLLVTPDDLRTGQPMPAGWLREPIAAAGRAHALLVSGGALTDVREAAGRLGVAHVFAVHVVQGAPMMIEPSGAPPPVARDAPAVALAGIARPERFFDALAADGWHIVDRVVYRDHHPFQPGDVARVQARVRRSGAALVVTTEKDLMRWLPLCPLPFPLAWVPIEARIEPAELFEPWLEARLDAACAREDTPGAGERERAGLHP